MLLKQRDFLTEQSNCTQFLGTGFRKTSCARVFLKKVKHENIVEDVVTVYVNKCSVEEYFRQRSTTFTDFCILFKQVEIKGSFLIKVFVSGGGVSSQISAIRYGIAKAVLSYVATFESTIFACIKKKIKDLGLVTRDARIVERKKYGFRKARKKKQYSKR